MEEEKIVIKKKSFAKFWKSALIALIVILIAIGIGYFGSKFLPERERPVYEFNGYTFKEEGPVVFTQLQVGNDLYTIPLRFGPRDLKDVNIEGNFSRFTYLVKTNGFMFLLLDDWEVRNGNLSMAVNEISKNVDKVLHLQTVAACTSNNSACQRLNMSVMSCDDAELPMVYFVPEKDAKIEIDGACITLYGDGEGIVRSADRLLLQWFGIMKQ